MKIGVLSDTHITNNLDNLPAKMLEDFSTVDMIIHVGDLVDLSVIERLKTACPNVKGVWGNMDSTVIRNNFPQKEIIKAGKFKIGVMHGWGNPAKLTSILVEEFKNDNVDMIIFGHSHNAVNEKIGNILFFNPGSPTDKIFAPFNSYGIISINDEIEAEIVKV